MIIDMNQITRVAVYAVSWKSKKLLLVRQKSGPFAGKYDFPGGGLEFGEAVEKALAREFAEESNGMALALPSGSVT